MFTSIVISSVVCPMAFSQSVSQVGFIHLSKYNYATVCPKASWAGLILMSHSPTLPHGSAVQPLYTIFKTTIH